jgi:flagellar hook-length control protein FliK
MHPGQHALDHAPGAAASSNGKGQGIGLASARTGGGEDTSAPGPGPRGTPIASTVAAADRPGAQPSVAEGGRTTPPPARDVPKDLAPRLGLDTPSRIDGSPAAAAGAAGPASPETGISTPPPPAGPAMAVAEMPVGSASETGSQALSSSASVGGPAAPATGQTGLATSSGNPQAMAQTAANQIVASLPRPLSELGTGTLEVALDPPELGRVRLSLVEVAGAMTLSITAERPETVELMRRHLDLLAQEFTRSGLDAPSVRVGTEGGGTHGHGPGADDAPDAHTLPGSGLPEAETGLPLHPAPATDPRRALDLRL